jgi:hypothetical protein
MINQRETNYRRFMMKTIDYLCGQDYLVSFTNEDNRLSLKAEFSYKLHKYLKNSDILIQMTYEDDEFYVTILIDNLPIYHEGDVQSSELDEVRGNLRKYINLYNERCMKIQAGDELINFIIDELICDDDLNE